MYHECREKFYVSNELTLRAQLTEFIDHKLIKLKTESDGYETIYLLIDDKNLKLYLDELKNIVVITDQSEINIYVFEKPNVNHLDAKQMSKI